MVTEQVPSVSVLMPVYNAERYLAKAVESILRQTFTNFEFIIINDGSTDSSLEILKDYALQDRRIHLVSRENRGLVKTLNESISLVRAPLIARMDADDIAMPDRLKVQKEYLVSNPEVLCVGGGCRVIDGKGRFLINADIKSGFDVVEKLALQGITPITHPAALMRTEAVKAVGGYTELDWPAEDLALWIKLSELGKLDNIPDIVLEYRIHEGSISTKHHETQLQKMKEICEAACARRGVDYPFLASEGRATGEGLSRYNVTLKHGWWAFGSGEWRTALVYGLKVLHWYPFKEGGWRLMVCALVKRPQKNKCEL
jgi:glycosyltransferase involved in cell wall biosynthesis